MFIVCLPLPTNGKYDGRKIVTLYVIVLLDMTANKTTNMCRKGWVIPRPRPGTAIGGGITQLFLQMYKWIASNKGV